MDWVDEKLNNIKKKIQNMSLKKALLAYLCVFTFAAFLLTIITFEVCQRWIEIFLERKEVSHLGILILYWIKTWTPFFYSIVCMFLTALFFYRTRLKKPFLILEEGMRKIREKDLNFKIEYDSLDEMGKLCISFEEMKKKLQENQEEMWKLVEEQKKLNAAFAHDLRTPLTVIRGYSDFLIKYMSKGAISGEKLKDTLKLLSEQAERLERFSMTMREVRNVEDIPVILRKVEAKILNQKIEGMVSALNEADEIRIHYETKTEKGLFFLDSVFFMEVLDNLLSNAIRYAEKEVTIQTELQGEYYYLYVTDDGQGFSRTALEQAKEVYYSESEEDGHFGIGLNLASVLCRKHQGVLSLANRMDGQGAIVSASFKIQKESKENILNV